ncbi:MAG: hypothetical protein CUN55_03525 [Phototrophicales bacterium]|nr:MAG: hypothetical protein CUN55_03525 [Phototrophicales bacterium]
MQNLLDSLKNYDTHLLTIIANRWDADIDEHDPILAAEQLAAVMLDPVRAAAEWERLKDNERGALQMLIASPSSKMTMAQFSRLHGEIRTMGPDKRKREKPHLKPLGVAEVLYYRGFVHVTIAESKTGPQPFVFVPTDLAKVLPTRQIGYDLSEEAPLDFPDDPLLADDEPMMAEVVLYEEPLGIQKPDTSIVDDLTTVLAYVQTHTVLLEDGYLSTDTRAEIMRQFIGPADERRLAFIMFLAAELQLLNSQDGLLHTIRANVKSWLENTRTSQMKRLIQSWHNTVLYNELWQVPTLIPELGKWSNDPRLIRQTLQELIQYMATDGWVSIDGILAELKASEPDFQRPGGDYDSWYIRDAATNQYLKGFESWDAVEGAVLRFTLTSPMFWLALVELGYPDDESTNQAYAFRLSAFGRAWVGRAAWPERPDSQQPIQINEQQHIIFPRANSRYDRFQLSRFASLVHSDKDTYIYAITSESLKSAAEQGIEASHIQAFLQRTLGQPIPTELEKTLSMWQVGASSSIVIESLLVLQTDLPDTLALLWETPELRRFLGRRLGPQAVVVRQNHAQALLEELQKRGLNAELIQH